MQNFRNIGDVVAGRYEVTDFIGAGSFAQVFRCRDRALDREVAIKLLHVEGMVGGGERARETFVERFNQEAMAVAKLQDPYTVTLFDSGTDQNGDLFMALEFVDGTTLREYVEHHGAIPHERVVKILKQCLSSLREAHVHGIIHRDIKPENIMIFDRMGAVDQIRVVDFGIVKVLQSTRDLTAVGMVVGTPRYLSPERVANQSFVPATDLYALGLVMYFLLCGHEVYSDIRSTIKLVQLHATPESITLPAEVDVPPGLRTIIDRMLEKDLARRYGAAQQILDALEEHIIDFAVSARAEQMLSARLLEQGLPPLSTSTLDDDPSSAKTEVMQSIQGPGAYPLAPAPPMAASASADATELVPVPDEFRRSPAAPQPGPASPQPMQAPMRTANPSFSPNTFSAPAIRPAAARTAAPSAHNTQSMPRLTEPASPSVTKPGENKAKYIIIALVVAGMLTLMMAVAALLLWKFVLNP